MKSPNYKLIFRDILESKYPEKKDLCKGLLSKTRLTAIDVLELNELIFGKKNEFYNPKYRSYSKTDILRILDYQKKHQLNNVQLANHFGLSRNTVAKWRKIFL